MKSGITMLIHDKDDIEFVTEFPCLLGHPVYESKINGPNRFKTMYAVTTANLTEGRQSNLRDITDKTLGPRSSFSFDFTHKDETNKFIQLHDRNFKHFCFSQRVFNRRSYD